MSVRPYLLLSVFILLSSFLQQEPANRVKKYSGKDGLSQNVVNSVVQDKKGFMWFATEDGLNRFDGYSFKVFSNASDNKSSLADNFIQSIYKDSRDNIWVSSRKGLQYFDRETEEFTLYQNNFRNSDLGGNDVSFISESPEHNLWLALYGNGFSYFDVSKKKFRIYNGNSLSGLSSYRTLTILEDKFGMLWVGNENDGLNVFEVSKGIVRKKIESLSDKKVFPYKTVRCIAEDKYGNIWMGTPSGLVVYKRLESKFYLIDHPKLEISGKSIFSLLQDSDENLWVGVHGGGLFKFDLKQVQKGSLENMQVEHIRNLGEYDISSKTIQSIYEDKSKNLWVGTYGDGVYLISHEKEKFIKVNRDETTSREGEMDSYYGVCNDKEGNLWLGTDGNGIFKSKLNGEVLKHYRADGKRGNLSDNAIISGLRDRQNQLWFGSYSHGVFKYDEEKDAFTNFLHDKIDASSQGANDVRVIFEDSKGNIWVGTNRGGLCLLDKKAGTFRHFRKSNVLLTNGDFRSMVEDKSGKLWLGMYGDGVYSLDPQTGDFKRHFYKSEEENLLKSNIVFSLALDHKNRLWIGTSNGGLSVYDLETKKIVNYNEKDGLANNTVYAISIDNSDKVWLSTNKGISVFDPEKKKFLNYNSFDGLQHGQFNPGSVISNGISGYIGFGGTKGFYIFNPYQSEEKSSTPQVIISGLQVFNKPVAINSTNKEEVVLPKVISESEEIELKYDDAVFSLEFLALNYSNPEKVNYAYRMEGLEDDWNYVDKQRIATYRYLQPGNYVFKVKASLDANTWDDKYTSIRITILPPLWRTPLAYVLYFFCFGILGLAVYNVRKKQRRLRDRLTVVKAQRRKERQLVKEKLSFFTEVSHEFRTPLTLMLGPLEEMINHEGSITPTGKKLKMVYRNANKLLNLINKLLDYRKADSGNVILKIREENVVVFVEEIFLSFKELAEKKNIHFRFCSKEPEVLLWFDKEKLEIILNNLVSNSFKYIGSGNEVSIIVSKTDESVVIEIADNGIGISKSQQKNIFEWFYQGDQSFPMSSGIGLSLTKKLVQLHHGKIEVESTENQGSKFRVQLPLGKEHFDPARVLLLENEPLKVIMEKGALEETEETEKSPVKGLKKVLIIEDDDEIRLFLKQYLEKKYLIYEAMNGREGMDVALAKHPDLIISDIMMPEMNGVDFCKTLKNNIKVSHIPIILLTAKTSLANQMEGAEIGADAYITKPFSPELLMLKIESLLNSRENLKRFYRNLFNMNSPKKVDSNNPDEKLLESIYKELKKNLDNPDFNVHELSEKMNMSRSLFYKKVKMLTGVSPIEYIRSIRLQEAAQLLKTEQYKVYEVMYLVGFSDQKYFRQCFAKEFGYSPSEYIKTAQMPSQ
jgi:signal transduction histidine kinase/ligand-binding sensor domain-containing protein/DNA-binding response OmpR family regulator